ncbi:Tn3 family transposase, partial [Marinobacteraceae bacterium S3BR75-40.1]
KREPRKPTNKEIRSYLQHLKWLKGMADQLPTIQALPVAKRHQFAQEARALDLAKMARLSARKRYALAIVLIRHQYAQSLDDAAELLIKMMQQLETTAQQHLQAYQLEQRQRVDRLVSCFKDVLLALESQPDPMASIQSAVGDDRQGWLDACEEHLAYAGNNYLPFMLRPFRAKRSLLYNCLEILDFQSTSSDPLSIQLIQLLRRTRRLKAGTLDLAAQAPELIDAVRDTRWTQEKWRRLIFTDSERRIVHRKYFELAVFALIKQELKSADLSIAHSDRFDDYRENLVDWGVYTAEIDQYAREVELPAEPRDLCRHLKAQLSDVSRAVDAAFPENAHAEIENGRIVIKRTPRAELPANWQELDNQITRRLGTQSITDVLVDAEQWLGLHRQFRPLSGYQSRIEAPRLRFIATLFCYGCNLGPSQTADSIKQLNRRQVAWLNLNHVTEERLDQAIVKVINAYKKYELPGYWGTGRHAAADGTKWNLHEQNLLSEYHIRYGGYGGIGYYHVSDTYIALFSHFIPCGVHEAVYILDGLLKNRSEIQPDTLHGDTQAQSYPVFGLAYLLGIKLMPRIRNLKELNFFRPDRRFRYRHIEDLFNGHI